MKRITWGHVVGVAIGIVIGLASGLLTWWSVRP